MKFLQIKKNLLLLTSFYYVNTIQKLGVTVDEDVESDFNPAIILPKVFGKCDFKIDEKIGVFDSNKKYIISITGVTTSGKSTVSKFIFEKLSQLKTCRPYLIHQDNYYKNDDEILKFSKPNPSLENKKSINYESPSAFNWDLLLNNIFALFNNHKEKFKDVQYSYNSGNTKTTKSVFPENVNVLIIEGLYAQCIFDDKPLNISGYDPCDVSKEEINAVKLGAKNTEIESFLKKNEIKVLKFFIDLPNEKIRKNRIPIDKRRAPDRTEQETINKINNFIIPSSDIWIRYAKNESDCILESKSRKLNTAVCIATILKYFIKGTNDIAIFNEFSEQFDEIK